MRYTTIAMVVALTLIVIGAGCRKAPATQQPASSPAAATVPDVLTEDPAASVSQDTTAGLTTDDTTAAIRADLERITLPELDAGFERVDTEIGGL